MSQNLREHVTLKMRLRVYLGSQVLERPRFRSSGTAWAARHHQTEPKERRLSWPSYESRLYQGKESRLGIPTVEAASFWIL